MPLNDDERFRAVYAQVVKLWATMESGTDAEIETETTKLTVLLQHAEPTNGA
jgi:hypothetical protein